MVSTRFAASVSLGITSCFGTCLHEGHRDERLVYEHALAHWHIGQSMVTEAIKQGGHLGSMAQHVICAALSDVLVAS